MSHPVSEASPLHSAEFRQQVERIDGAIARLRHLTQADIQAHWRGCQADLSVAEGTNAENWEGWAIAPLNARHHIAWDRGQRVLWLGQSIRVPDTLTGFPLEGLALRLALTWWAEDAQIYVNGALTHTGDLFDCFTRILLNPAVEPGDTINVAIRLVSPGHDDGALVRSRCLYENPDHSLAPVPEPGFVADELEVLRIFLQALAPDQLSQVAAAIDPLDWSALPQRAQFNSSLTDVRQRLLPLSPWLKQRTIHLLGHAHLDLAWLWPIADTWDAAQRTFESILSLQNDHPDLVFTHSTPALYAWIEDHRPDLFQAIQAQVKAERWEVGAGLWVEPELNLVGGESIVRQVLYGQRYTREKFGQMSRIAWLPDSFGFCWQLPQILKQGGIDYFATQKLRWNDTHTFPHDLFWWRSPDGSTLLSLTLPPIGTDVDPVKMATYACQWELNTGYPDALWLPGIGDHGGGPTRDMLDLAHRWQRSPFFPSLTFTAAQPFLDQLSASPAPPLSSSPPPPPSLPTWSDELYLELHRGCYTTHADQKRWNRRCEALLYQAELFASLATLILGTDYPADVLEHAWKQVLFNQFHDILPGSSIPEVYAEANPHWQAAEATAEQLVQDSMEAIAHSLTFSPPPHPDSIPIVVFNPLPWERSEVISLPLPQLDRCWTAFTSDGQPCNSQQAGDRLLVQTPPIPSIGYRQLWLTPTSLTSPTPSTSASPPTWTLENSSLRVEIDPQTGDINRIIDKAAQRDVLSGPGNPLQAFRDEGQYWDAWNIAPDYAEHPRPAPQVADVRWMEWGSVQQRLRTVRHMGRSRIQQDYVLQADSPILRIETEVDWQETHTLLKAAFPIAFPSNGPMPTATYEMPCGAIERSPAPTTPDEKAKWEVPALNWADLGTHDYGISLLSDHKHGYDANLSCLRLTLLKSPLWPDPTADRGHHAFTYALYPHAHHWSAAATTRHGYALNQPLRVIWVNPSDGSLDEFSDESTTRRSPRSATLLPPVTTLLDALPPNLCLMAFKRSEDQVNRWVLRLYEAHGETVAIAPQTLVAALNAISPGLRFIHRADLLEDRLHKLDTIDEQSDCSGFGTGDDERVAIAPWQIVTFVFEACS